MIYFITGLPGVGKTTLAEKLSKILLSNNNECILLDGDNMRRCWPYIGYLGDNRTENIRRIQLIAKLFHDENKDVIVSAVAPLREMREKFREMFSDNYTEILLTKIHDKRPDHYYCEYEQSSISPEYTDDVELLINKLRQGQ